MGISFVLSTLSSTVLKYLSDKVVKSTRHACHTKSCREPALEGCRDQKQKRSQDREMNQSMLAWKLRLLDWLRQLERLKKATKEDAAAWNVKGPLLVEGLDMLMAKVVIETVVVSEA